MPLQGNDVKVLQVHEQNRPAEPSMPPIVLSKVTSSNFQWHHAPHLLRGGARSRRSRQS
jgi:hypothetical protein